MSTVHRWKITHADHMTVGNGATAKRFLVSVIEPAWKALDGQIAVNRAEVQAGNGLAEFGVHINESLRNDTSIAFCLAIQALWERQLRVYIFGCAEELRMDKEAKMALANSWSDVEKAFFSVRGLSLGAFADYGHLQVLHKLGSACRHGPGKSMDALKATHPEYWPGGNRLFEFHKAMAGVVISIEHLRGFVSAIEGFWDEIAVIRNASKPTPEEEQALWDEVRAFEAATERAKIAGDAALRAQFPDFFRLIDRAT